MTAWRAGAVAASSGKVTSLAITIPAAVQAGDIVMFVASASNTSTNPVITASSTGTTPAQIGSTVNFTGTNGFPTGTAIFWFKASSSDASKVITMSGTTSSYLGISLGSWSGCAATQPDVSATPTSNTGSMTYTAPTVATLTTADWAVYLVGCFVSSTSFSGNPGTLREFDTSARTALADSNGPVGAAGTSIGGGTWSQSVMTSGWAGFTVGLTALPQPGTPPAAPGQTWLRRFRPRAQNRALAPPADQASVATTYPKPSAAITARVSATGSIAAAYPKPSVAAHVTESFPVAISARYPKPSAAMTAAESFHAAIAARYPKPGVSVTAAESFPVAIAARYPKPAASLSCVTMSGKRTPSLLAGTATVQGYGGSAVVTTLEGTASVGD